VRIVLTKRPNRFTHAVDTARAEPLDCGAMGRVVHHRPCR